MGNGNGVIRLRLRLTVVNGGEVVIEKPVDKADHVILGRMAHTVVDVLFVDLVEGQMGALVSTNTS